MSKSHDHHNHNHNHNHNHDHDHGHAHHGHSHHHAPKSYNLAFGLGISLNIIFVIIEFSYGFFSKSLALMADAGHNLSDVAGLILAWGAVWLMARKPTDTYSFGFRKSTILSALFNSIILLVAVGIIIWEAIDRLRNPTPIMSSTVMIVAGIGIVINGLTALLFFRDKDHDINLKGAYLHMAADALISFGVVLSALVISYTSWNWLDPLVSIIISLVIIYGTWDLLKVSIHLSMDAVPHGIKPREVKKYLESIQDVKEAHDLHIWPMSTTENALSVHLTVKNIPLTNEKLVQIGKDLKEKFKIDHPTIQVELFDENFECAFKSDQVV
ncbi:MAG: cation diffusion facilitator family transporter [Bdellovibrionales bacterium]|nr:cation diffusion facilitator family transporter [Bdellovibrionales bacterium]